MTNSLGAAALAAAVVFGSATRIDAALVAPAAERQMQSSQASKLTARRHDRRHYHSAYRPPYYPYYYGRPSIYAPAPFVPIPPLFGYGWEWW